MEVEERNWVMEPEKGLLGGSVEVLTSVMPASEVPAAVTDRGSGRSLERVIWVGGQGCLMSHTG